MLAGLSCLSGCSNASAQFGNPFSSTPSFGLLNKKNITLHSKLPPIYNATGQTVSIKSGDALLTIQIEKQLTQSDSTIHVGDLNADLLIECSVSQSTPIHMVTVKTDNGSEEHQQGTLSVIFRISQLRKKLVVKSDVATSILDEVTKVNTNATAQKKVFGMTVPSSGASSSNKQTQFHSTMDAQNYLVDQVARKIASYVVTTETTVTVPLAVGGALNGPNKLADSALWPRYKEALEEQTPASDAKVDAFRTYDIGVADEALGYTAQDSKSAITFLEQASNEYAKAIEARPEEKNFIQAQSRIKAALQYYSDIGKLQPMTTGKAPALTTNLVAKTPAAESALTNSDVIDMVKASMDEANIVDTIANAPDINFDLTPQGQIALTRAGVKGSILAAMKQRTRGAGPASSQPLGRKR